MKKVLVIVGPTASGKSSLAIKLAKKFKGEIISADSRQVYKGLNIGTGKVTKREMQGIPHHLLNVVNPKKIFTAEDYKKLATKSLEDIFKKSKFPIIVGGTGFYIDALVGKTSLPDVPPNKLLRRKLNRLSKEKLFKILEKKDSRRARSIDKNNKVRLVRALEIIETLGKVPRVETKNDNRFVYIGLKPHDLDKRIYKRLIKRIPGIIRETKKLSSKRAYSLGLEYRYASLYLKKKLTQKEFVDELYGAIRKYAKRQMTWFKKNNEIKWFKPEDYKGIEKHVKTKIYNAHPPYHHYS